MKIIIIVTFYISICANVYSNNDGWRLFDKRFYHPEDIGLRDLVFKVKINNLKEEINRTKTMGVIKEIYFLVYWTKMNKIKIEVKGLPSGFKEKKEYFRTLVKNYLDFVLPQKLVPKMRSYSIKHSKVGSDDHYRGVSRDGMQEFSEINMIFDEKGRLKEFKTMGSATSLASVNKAVSTMGKKPWSNNKWVLDELSVEISNTRDIKKVMNYNILYTAEKSYGFPKSISTNIYFEKKSASKKIVKSKIIKQTILFSDYKINSGLALKIISKAEEKVKKQKTK